MQGVGVEEICISTLVLPHIKDNGAHQLRPAIVLHNCSVLQLRVRLGTVCPHTRTDQTKIQSML